MSKCASMVISPTLPRSAPRPSTAGRVTGIEVNPTAVEDAQANARRAGLQSVSFRQADVRQGLASCPKAVGETIVLDPPRTGAGPDVARAVSARRPATIVYVSCDPPTLARDLKAFSAAGYRLESVSAFDMFPDTYHLETVARLLPA